MFPAWHIALTALITAGLSGGGTWLFASHQRSVVDALLVGIAAGLGILLWPSGWWPHSGELRPPDAWHERKHWQHSSRCW
jgi:hypothetical protein